MHAYTHRLGFGFLVLYYTAQPLINTRGMFCVITPPHTGHPLLKVPTPLNRRPFLAATHMYPSGVLRQVHAYPPIAIQVSPRLLFPPLYPLFTPRRHSTPTSAWLQEN